MRRRIAQLVVFIACCFCIDASVPPVPRPTSPMITGSPAFSPDWDLLAEKQRISQWVEGIQGAERQQVEREQAARRRAASSRQSASQVTGYEGDGDRFDRLAACESGMRQDAVGGGGRYLSFFQWALSTWHAAGGTGDPRDSDYATQKAIAMSWAEQSNPASQWPVCWPRSA